MVLTWKVPESDGGTPITHYIIESRPDTRSTWANIGKTKAKVLTFMAEDLREGTEYHFRVSAVNAEGQGPALDGLDTATPMKKKGKSNVLINYKSHVII